MLTHASSPEIKAAVCRAFAKPLSIEPIKLRSPGYHEVKVRIKACAICHSDISYIDGIWGGDLPTVFGHEASGIVMAKGGGVIGYEIDDHVMVTLIRSCGHCPSCASGAGVLCDQKDHLTSGSPIQSSNDKAIINQAMNCGAFAEYVVVHHSQLAKIPKKMPFTSAAVLSCAGLTGIGAVVNSAKLRVGDSVVVIGAGGVGLNAIQGAYLAGADKIIAIDLLPEKLKIAKHFGASHGVMADSEKPWRQIKTITQGRMADAVFVTVGSTAAYDLAPRLLGRMGNVYMLGMPASGQKSHYEPVIFAAVGHGMKGSKMGDVVLARDVPWMISMYEQDRLNLDDLISNTWALADINHAIADTKSGTAKRNVIVFD